MLYTTKINSQTDIEYRKFIEICNEVLPLKIETSYINLDNIIEEYLSMLFAMGWNDNETLKMGLISGKLNDNINKQYKDEFNVSRKIKEIVQKDSYSSSDYEALIILAQMGKNLAVRKEQSLSTINKNQKETIQKNESSSEIQNIIPDVISRMKVILKSISELNLDSNKRLDNLKITERHINQINNLSMDDKSKQKALSLLNEFLKTRKNAFKVIEDFAFHILEKYQRRETDFSKELFEKYRLSSIALEAFDLGDGVFSKGNFIFNDSYSDELLTTSKIYNAYMNGEDISLEELKNAREKEMDYNCSLLIDEVESVIKRQLNSGFNM